MDLNSIREWTDFIVQEIGRDELTGLIKSIALWGLLGAIVGVVLVVVTYRFFRRLRWYGCTSTAGRWLQRGVCALTLLLCILLIGGAGAWEGVHRKSHDVVTRSRIGTNALPAIADLVAEGFAWIDLTMQAGEKLSPADSESRLEEFRAGEWEVDVPAFLQRIDSLREGVFQDLLTQLEQTVHRNAPALNDGLMGKLLHQTIQMLGPALLEKKLSSELERRGLEHLHVAIRTKLTAEAARSGEPSTISYRELSSFIQREGIVPAVVTPIRSFARQQQVLYVVIAFFLLIVPPVIFRVCRRSVAPDLGASQAKSGA
jgi:hypothetical protein